jgi:RNA 2',3'-cyclic 3'-phosphodiesterase
MPRLFLGLDLPNDIDIALQMFGGGIQDARWQTLEQLHLTLHFLDEVDGGELRELSSALDDLEAPAFDLQLRGVGVFPPRGQPRTLWVGVAEPEPVRLLHRRCARIIDELGLDRDRRKYTPHVTIARFGTRVVASDVGEWMRDHALYASRVFRVEHVHLYSSLVGQRGSKYRIESSHPLDLIE